MISVIIPVYNAAGYLQRCLNSLLHQSYGTYEIWLINDGSTDDSAAICDEYARNYDQFHVYHGENKGVSHARNIGIEKARGEFIAFVDADDYVERGFLADLYPTQGEDFSVCGHRIIKYNEQIREVVPDFNSINDLINTSVIRNVWGKLFKKTVIKEVVLKFDVSLGIGEDTLFVLTYLKQIVSFKVSKNIGYVYVSPTYNINKYRSNPINIIDLRKKLLVQELEMKNKMYDVEQLNSNNSRVVGFNLLTLLYLSREYSFEERRRFIHEFKTISDGDKIGLSSRLESTYNILCHIGNPKIEDAFLLLTMKLIWWKAKVFKR